MPGLARLLRGILKYEQNLKGSMVESFKQIADKPQPAALVFSCMDSRLIVTRLLQSEPGDYFLIRNAGNIVPKSFSQTDQTSTSVTSTEPAALDFACNLNNIANVVVWGHSDCKAMNLLFSVKDEESTQTGSPLEKWVKNNGQRTIELFHKMKSLPPEQPLTFNGPLNTFEAFIDSSNKFADRDKFSQINALVQTQNIESYPFLREKLQKNEVRLNTIWFDVYTGDFYIFSRPKKTFLDVSNNMELLLEDPSIC